MKKSKILSVIAIALAVLIGGGASAYAFIEPLHNAVNLNFQNPGKLYQDIESDYFSDITKSFSSAYEQLNNVMDGENQVGFNTSLKVSLGQQLIDEIGVPDLESVAINSSFSSKAKMSAENISLDYNGEKLVTLNTSTDLEKGMAYIQVPELSDSYVSVNAEDLGPYLEEQGVSLDQLLEMYGVNDFTSLLNGEGVGKLDLTQKDIEDIIKRYSDILITSMSDISREKNVEGTIDGVDYKYTTLTYDITYRDFYNVAKSCLNELKDDDVIRDFLVKYADITEDEYNDEIESALDSLKDSKDDPYFYGFTGDEEDFDLDDDYATLTTYVNSDMQVVGRELDVKDEGKKINFGYIIIDNDKNYALKEWAEVDKEEVFIAEGSAKKDGELMTGSFEIVSNAEGEEVTIIIDMENYGVIDKDANLISGKMTLSGDIEGMDFEGIIDCKVENKKQTINYIINMDEEMMVNIDFSYENTEVSDVVLPGEESSVYNALNDDDMQKFMQEMDIVGFTNKMTDVLGEDIVNGIMYGGFSDEDYDDFDFDENNYSESTIRDGEFDFSKLGYTINGDNVKLPCEFSLLKEFLPCDVTSLEADGTAYGTSEDFFVNSYIINDTSAELPIEKCKVINLSVDQGGEATLNIVVNGIKIGSTVQEVANAFGVNDVSENMDTLYIYDSNGTLNELDFYFIDGKVSTIVLDFYE